MLYIHQFPDWTKFRYNHQVIHKILGQTRLSEGKLLGLAELMDTSALEAQVLAEDLAYSGAIDGHSTDVAKMLGEVTRAEKSTSLEIRNHLGALTNFDQPLSHQRIQGWHAPLGQNQALRYRTRESAVEGQGKRFQGVSPYRLETEMENFFKWFETAGEDGLIKAAIAQFWLLTIRPFDDGNGRIARLATSMAIARSENSSKPLFSLNAQIMEGREKYLEILYRCQSGNGDLTEWILWFLETAMAAIQRSLNILKPSIHKLQFQNRMGSLNLSSRERMLLEALTGGDMKTPFTVKEYAALVGVSHDTALRSLQSLMAQGCIQQNKGGRSTCYSLAE